MSLLETFQLTVTYGGVHANDHIDLAVDEGKIVGLIGPNGAGKTTLIDTITGFTPPNSGTVRFNGRPIDGLSPNQRADIGLTRTFQSLELFEDLSVYDNLVVATERPRWYSALYDMVRPTRRREDEDHGRWALDFLSLEPVHDRLPSELSHGERKLVSVARALATRPRLVLLDEPAAGLDTAETQILGTHLRSLLARGTTVFLIDHDMSFILAVCDYIYVLDFGRIIAQGTPAEVRANPSVIAAYLGSRPEKIGHEESNSDTAKLNEGLT